jgi:putative endonuclease
VENSGESTRDIGKKAEEQACTYLEEIGYKIVKRNFFFGKVGEIDIVAKDQDIMVFIEVKARSSDSYGSPLDSITPKKQRSIRKVAEGYFYINKLENQECRFDVITIDYSKSEPQIEHYINAFY